MTTILSLAKVKELYSEHDGAHGFNHIKDVVKRVIKMTEFVEQHNVKVNKTVVQNAALLHDITRHIDDENHNESGANKAMEILRGEFGSKLSQDLLNRIHSAIYEHRASYSGDLSSIESEILSSADRTAPGDIEKMFKRAFLYSMDKEKCETIEEGVERAYNHIISKYGENGYAKFPDVYKSYYAKEFEEMQRTLKYTTLDQARQSMMKSCPDYFKK